VCVCVFVCVCVCVCLCEWLAMKTASAALPYAAHYALGPSLE